MATKPKVDVLAELLKVTGEPAPKKDEPLKDFVKRMCEAMADEKVTDDMFKALSPEAKKWYESSLELYEADKYAELVSLPGMPGFEAAPPAPAAQAADPKAATPATAAQLKETDVAKKPTKKAAAKETKKTAAPKAAAKPKEKAERKPRTDSTTYKVRMAVVKKPDITFDAVVKATGLKGKEASPSSHAFNTFQHARSVIALYNEHGK